MVFAQNVFWAMTGHIVRRVRGIQAEMNDRQSVVCYESVKRAQNIIGMTKHKISTRLN